MTTAGKTKVEMVHKFHNADNFKQKEAMYLNTLIGSSRLSNDMQFDGYGSMTFDEEDTQHGTAILQWTDENGEPMPYSRKNSSCLVYTLKKTDHNPGTFDKLFLYHTMSHSGTGLWYGWIAYNTHTKKYTHRFFIDHDPQDLMHALNKWLYHLQTVKTSERILSESRINSHKFI